MKFGIVPINLQEFTNPELLIPFVQRAEALGYESVWTAEHVIIPKTYTSVYPYSPSGKLPFPPDAAIIDPLVALTFIAAATTRLRLGTGVNILPQTNPLYLAKWASSLDHLSRGRLMLGVGIGWLREEFEAIGVPFAGRGRRADDYLQALKVAWSGEEVNYHSEFVRWHGFLMRPRPAQPGGVPLVIGGVSAAAIRRAVRYGDGWYVIGKDLAAYRSHMRTLADECARQGRDQREIEITAYWNYYREGVESLAVYEELGVHRLLINVHALRERSVTVALERFAETVIAKYGSVPVELTS
ncbi:MAG: LLM class F420-dependent oxidoreductase [Thermodesulfobacteriota bacterium]|jgi:probable F420-dependent oxidoreductase